MTQLPQDCLDQAEEALGHAHSCNCASFTDTIPFDENGPQPDFSKCDCEVMKVAQALFQEREKAREEGRIEGQTMLAHETKDGYCCACGYDIAEFEQGKKDAALSAVQECVRAIEDFWTPEYDAVAHRKGLRQDVLKVVQSIEARMREGKEV